MPTRVEFYEPEENPGTGGLSMNRTGQVKQTKNIIILYLVNRGGDSEYLTNDGTYRYEVLPISYMENDLYPHEVSHSIDRPVETDDKEILNLDRNQRLIPDADLELMQNSLLSNPGYNPIKFGKSMEKLLKKDL